MGIRGTIFDFFVEGDRLTDVVVLEGEVDLCVRGGSCERMSRACGMSEASSGRSSVVSYSSARRNEKIRRNFPYVVSQDPLREDFHGPVGRCGRIQEIVREDDRPPKPDPVVPPLEEPKPEEPQKEEPKKERPEKEKPESEQPEGEKPEGENPDGEQLDGSREGSSGSEGGERETSAKTEGEENRTEGG